jgi:H+-transporting ATPase
VGKRTEATVEDTNRDRFKVTKGAPQVILALSSNVEQVQPQVDNAIALSLPSAAFAPWG